jgi:hypothetical protein
MKLTFTAALSLALGASIAHAECAGSGTPLFHCTFQDGAKSVSICLQNDVALYSFGAAGRSPEMLLGRRVEAVEMTPWSGVGRSIWEEVRIYNDIYSYILSYAIDRSGEMPIDARLIVAEGEESQLAELICDTGSVRHADFYPLFEAKEAAGQRYCAETYTWGGGC